MKSLLIAAAGSMLAACSPTAHERYGDVARYAPSYGGYVLGGDEEPLVLRDPVTSEKIRCRDDLERVAPALVDVLDDETRDRNARRVAPIALGPISLAAYGAALLGIGLWYPAAAFGEGVASAPPGRVYDQARAAFLAGRYEVSRERFLTVVIERGRSDADLDQLPVIFVEHSLYYLALSDEALHRDAEAEAAFRRFLTTSTRKNELRYRDAEARLARLEGPRAVRCGSRADYVLPSRSR
jgi:hypothetical protein